MLKIKDYPRPQFVRTNWLNLNGSWSFLFDDENIGEKQKYYESFPKSTEIIVPFTYETKKSGIDDEKVHQNIWYSKDIKLSKTNKTLLHLEGSDYVTKVWLNGIFIGKNKGGYHRFTFDITTAIIDGINNITIKVEDSLSKSQPRGKQRYKNENFKCWYVQTTGIWKTIWLENVPLNYIKDVKVTPDYDMHNVDININFDIENNDFSNYELETEISFENKKVSTQRNSLDDKSLNYIININDDLKAWSPDTPNLYDIVYRLYYDGEIIDEVYSYFGVRKITTSKAKIYLNDQEIYLRMVLDQGYWQESHLTPPNEEAILEDINIIRKYGYNGVRKHQKIEDERFLYYCDVMGILVWSEMANFYEYNDQAISDFTEEWLKVVKQNYNHPSIITWVPINESWGIKEILTNKSEQSFCESMYYLTKAFDRTRPVISNDGWEHTISDIITIHDYKQDSDLIKTDYSDNKILENEKAYNGIHKLFPINYKYNGEPIVISEYGGVALVSEKGWGYGKQVANEEEFLERFSRITKAFQSIPYVSGYCYTQLTDVQQEINGLVKEDRQDKFSEKIIKEIKRINENIS